MKVEWKKLKIFITGTIPHHLRRVDMYGYDKSVNNRLFITIEFGWTHTKKPRDSQSIYRKKPNKST